MKEWKTRPQRWHQQPKPEWHQHRRWFFWRFMVVILIMGMIITGVVAVMARLFTLIFGGSSEISLLVLVGSCSLLLSLPVFAVVLSWTVFRRMATPIAQVMAVTEAVAGGDLTARVETTYTGRFGRLTRSLNNMVGELERNNEQRRQLTADIAHELRTPLHIIQGNLEGILDGVYSPTDEHISNTLEETQILARLVDDLGTLSLAESGQLPMQMEKITITDLFSDIETSFSGPAESVGITFQVHPPSPSTLNLYGDPLRLNQVLGNLVVNSIRHTPAGGIITLSANSDHEWIRIIVTDTGEGIPAEDLPHIFDRFWRGDRARTHIEGTGGGLGLAIAQQLVLAHGGTIQVESSPGLGATFTIDLPQHKPQPDQITHPPL